MNIYQSNTYIKGLSWLHFNGDTRVQDRQQMLDQQSHIPVSVAYVAHPSSSQEHQTKHDYTIPCKAVWQRYRDKKYPQEKKTSWKKPWINFSCRQSQQQRQFKNLFQFERGRLLQDLRQFFFKTRPIHFHAISTRVIRLVKQNKLGFSSIEINKPLPSSIWSVSQGKFKFRDHFQLLLAAYEMLDNT